RRAGGGVGPRPRSSPRRMRRRRVAPSPRAWPVLISWPRRSYCHAPRQNARNQPAAAPFTCVREGFEAGSATPETMSTETDKPDGGAGNFVRDIMLEDQASKKHGGRVATRFPPEPNGYLHIGHAKAIGIDFGLAQEFGGTCNLRFDDTNPTTEDVEYVEAIEEDIRWLGYEWSGLYYASDYFEQLYQLAEKLIERGKAYVDSLSEEQIREYRGDFYRKGQPTPYRDRPAAESLDLLRRMRAGEFPEGAHVLRAKISLESQNMNLRDPVLYRIRYAPHHRTGSKWCIYPMYDYAHPISDAVENITHSICTLEFEAHRPLYDWCLRET